jgi:hypothetical protein
MLSTTFGERKSFGTLAYPFVGGVWIRKHHAGDISVCKEYSEDAGYSADQLR